VSTGESLDQLLVLLHEAGVEFIVVGGMAGVLHGAPIVTKDLDIVHRKTPENIAKLLALLLPLDAYHRADLANRHLPPTADGLNGHGHLNLATRLGPLDVLCELAEGEDYESLLPDSEMITEGTIQLRVLGLPRLITVKARTGRAKDRMALPILIATLQEREKGRP
jgi:hypothetical protein